MNFYSMLWRFFGLIYYLVSGDDSAVISSLSGVVSVIEGVIDSGEISVVTSNLPLFVDVFVKSVTTLYRV